MFGKRRLLSGLHIVLVIALLFLATLLMRGRPAGVEVSMGVEEQGSMGGEKQSLVSNTQSPTSSRTITYIYDDAGRLVQADYGDDQGIAYTYDEAGNLLQREVYGVATATPTSTSTPTPTPTATATPTPTATATVSMKVYLPLVLKGHDGL